MRWFTRAATVVAVGVMVGAGAVGAAATATAADGLGKVTFAGTVKGSDGRPLAGVEVDILTPGGFPFFTSEQLASGKTANDGSYRVTLPAYSDPMRIQFVPAKATGGTSATGYENFCYGATTPNFDDDCGYDGKTYQVKAGRTYQADVALNPAAVLRGRLVDVQGRGVGSFPVYLYRGNGDRLPDGERPLTQVLSDVNGNYLAPRLAAGSYLLCFGDYFPAGSRGGTPARDGYSGSCLADRVTLKPGRTTTVDDTLQGRGALAGTVVDGNGAPIANATVEVFVDPLFLGPVQATSAADGTFRVGGIDAGQQPWCVQAENFKDVCDNPPTAKIRPFQTTDVGTVVLQRES